MQDARGSPRAPRPSMGKSPCWPANASEPATVAELCSSLTCGLYVFVYRSSPQCADAPARACGVNPQPLPIGFQIQHIVFTFFFRPFAPPTMRRRALSRGGFCFVRYRKVARLAL
eukprot:6455516-Pyramimonas_sp.AAC.1